MSAVSEPTVDPGRYRAVLGRFCTGVTVVTAMDGAEPVGFACQSFAALSLRPPLVLFCPRRGSATWPAIARSGRFAVNVLGAAQRGLCAVFGAPGVDRFAGVDWTPSAGGCPLLDGAVAWVDATVDAVHDAGDHYVVVGGVTDLGDRPGEPLLYLGGRYAEPAPASAFERGWPRPDDWL